MYQPFKTTKRRIATGLALLALIYGTYHFSRTPKQPLPLKQFTIEELIADTARDKGIDRLMPVLLADIDSNYAPFKFKILTERDSTY